MDKICIKGGIPLKGKIHISGAKNSALPLMAASLLTEESLILENLPHLADISTMANLLIQHGVSFHLDGNAERGGHSGEVIKLEAKNINNFEAPYDIVRKMRASVLVLGPLLTRHGRAKVSLPGGCAIGTRPIDIHLAALESMGANINLQDGYIIANVLGGLKGANIVFPKVSVGATENIMMAASLAKGTTIMDNAAMEPEIIDLAMCLNQMGALIHGAGTPRIIIEGVQSLKGTLFPVIPDRIETGTYMIAAAITNGDIELIGSKFETLSATIEKLEQAGVCITKTQNGIRVKRSGQDIRAVDVVTGPYPNFATDMQAQLMALMSVASGTSHIVESIFENRFMHVPELCRLGANINIDGNCAIIKGSKKLKAAQLMATDLRASVSLVLAALVAEGETIINRMYHIDRGYQRIEEKLSSCGAQITRLRA